MSLKKKLVATIGMFCLTCALLLVGVWAISSTSVEIGGTISFQATNIFATVEGEIQGAGAGAVDPTTLNYTLTDEPTDEQLATWKQDLKFKDTADAITYTITITNNSGNRNIMVAVVDTSAVGTNIEQEVALTVNGKTAEYVSGKDYLLKPQQTAVVVATFTVDPDVTTTGDYGFDVNLVDESVSTHEHEYTGEIYYIVEDGVAYTVQDCDCGKTGNKTAVENAVVATLETAQSILDSDINGKTVVFANGTYGNLEIRPTVQTTTKLFAGSNRETELDISNISNLSDDEIYGYERRLEDVKFVGTEEAYFSGVIAVQSDVLFTSDYTEVNRYTAPTRTQIGLSKYDPADSTTDDVYDVIRDTFCNADNYYVAYVPMKNISFENMNFIGKFGRIYVRNITDNDGIENITISNCSFVTDEAYSQPTVIGTSPISLGAVAFSNGSSRDLRDRNIFTPAKQHTFKNITIENCYVNGHETAFGVYNFENVTITNNVVENVKAQAFYVQSIAPMAAGSNTENSGWFTGEVVISNNIIRKPAGIDLERAIRFGGLKNAVITIKNNIFENCVDPENELFKSQAVADEDGEQTIITFEGNTYNGIDLENKQWTGKEWTEDMGRVYVV